jgi:tetratricopeptide (TPR) repeat protein
MPEITKTLMNIQKSHIKILIAIASVVLLLLVYGIGMVVLPMTILYSYQSKNCDSAFSLNGIYTSIYPAFLQDKTVAEPIKECTAYTLATSNEENGNWHEAYDAYQVYSNTYPSGLYLAEAHDHSAAVLMSLAQDQSEQRNYPEAVENLNLITSTYSDTSTAAEALTAISFTYVSWGAGLRESGEFGQAEQVFNDFKTWSQNNQKAELQTTAQNELTQTYLTWGLDLQSQNQFEDALSKFDTALSVDPASASDSAAEAKAGQINAYIEWGNDLLKQNDFAGAIAKFELAVSRADGNIANDARNALANGQIQWASALSSDDDFDAALDHLKLAQEHAATDTMKQNVDSTYGDVYLAFSNSSGVQAQRVMKEAYRTICDQHKKPELPIFGLNKDLIRVGLYGVDAQLPENLVARTPGELHYVACVGEEKHTVSTKDSMVLVQRTSRGNYYKWTMQFRVQLLWNINLQKTETAETVAEKSFMGKMPPPFPDTAEVTYIYGPPPDMAEMAKWFESVIK